MFHGITYILFSTSLYMYSTCNELCNNLRRLQELQDRLQDSPSSCIMDVIMHERNVRWNFGARLTWVLMYYRQRHKEGLNRTALASNPEVVPGTSLSMTSGFGTTKKSNGTVIRMRPQPTAEKKSVPRRTCSRLERQAPA